MANVARFNKPTVKFPTQPKFTKPQMQYLQFLQRFNPLLYRRGIEAGVKAARRDTQLSSVGDVDWGGIFTAITSAVKDAAPAVLQLKQQRDLLKIQAQRAKKGMPPIAPEAYAQYATPAVGYSAELPPGSLPTTVIPYAGGKPMSKWIMWGGIGLLAIGLIWFLTKK